MPGSKHKPPKFSSSFSPFISFYYHIQKYKLIIYWKMNGNIYQSGTICYPFYCEESLVLRASFFMFFNTSINKNDPEKMT